MRKDIWYNNEGYFDPTCGEAMLRVELERVRKAAAAEKRENLTIKRKTCILHAGCKAFSPAEP